MGTSCVSSRTVCLSLSGQKWRYLVHNREELGPRVIPFQRNNGCYFENDVLFGNDTGILGKRNSEFSQQESNLRPSDYLFGRSTTELQETLGASV